MRATFWGVRGSIPAPGADTQIWGGNTSCVEIRHKDYPPLILDCGTGARCLGKELVQQSGRQLDLLFSHFHMDHLFGFPYFLPIYTPGYEVRITAPAFSNADVRNKFGSYLNGIFHPVRLREVLDNLSFSPVEAGQERILGAYTVKTCRLNHPGGAVGYRMECEGQSIAYLSDTGPFSRPGEGVLYDRKASLLESQLISFLQGTQIVIYDAMYTQAEYLERMNWGHSYPEYAHAICKAANVERLVLFHHSPDASDVQLSALASHWAASRGPLVSVAKERCVVHAEG